MNYITVQNHFLFLTRKLYPRRACFCMSARPSGPLVSSFWFFLVDERVTRVKSLFNTFEDARLWQRGNELFYFFSLTDSCEICGIVVFLGSHEGLIFSNTKHIVAILGTPIGFSTDGIIALFRQVLITAVSLMINNGVNIAESGCLSCTFIVVALTVWLACELAYMAASVSTFEVLPEALGCDCMMFAESVFF